MSSAVARPPQLGLLSAGSVNRQHELAANGGTNGFAWRNTTELRVIPYANNSPQNRALTIDSSSGTFIPQRCNLDDLG